MHPKIPKKRFDSVPPNILLFMAWRNIKTKKLRSLLTILGVTIGIGAIFFLLSLGLGLQNLVTTQVIGNQSIKSIDVSSPNSRILKLDKKASNTIKNLSHVAKLGNSYSFAGALKLSDSNIDTVVYGIDTNYQELLNLSAIKGRLLDKKDFKSAIINTSALKAIGSEDPVKIIGKKLNLTIPLQPSEDEKSKTLEDEYTIVGVIDSGSGSEIFIPTSTFDNAYVEQYSQIKLVTDDTTNISSLRKRIESLGFETTSPIDTIDQINQIFKYFNVILVAIGAIGMIVAILGMFNTLTISLIERTREIGLMVSLGGRRRDMRSLFVLEAVLFSLIGSIVGISMAVITGKMVNFGMNRLASGKGVTETFNVFSNPWWLIVSLTITMVLIGILVVLLPARRAEKINPIDALRRE